MGVGFKDFTFWAILRPFNFLCEGTYPNNGTISWNIWHRSTDGEGREFGKCLWSEVAYVARALYIHRAFKFVERSGVVGIVDRSLAYHP